MSTRRCLLRQTRLILVALKSITGDCRRHATGGLQVQIWRDQQNVGYKSEGTAAFNINAETMTWTQYMEQNGNSLKFGVSSGVSLTWSSLGFRGPQLTCGDFQTTLNNYRSDYSAARSTITYGAVTA